MEAPRPPLLLTTCMCSLCSSKAARNVGALWVCSLKTHGRPAASRTLVSEARRMLPVSLLGLPYSHVQPPTMGSFNTFVGRSAC